MSGYIWNFINSFSFEKPLSSYTVDELNIKLRELDMDKHLDTLEKAFEVQKVIIDKLKQENDILKRELRDLRSKHQLDNNDLQRLKIPYPELKTVLTYVKWSSLDNNALESRIVDQFRLRLIGHRIELEVQPYGGDKTIIQPLVIFCPLTHQLNQEVERILCEIRDKCIGPIIILITHELLYPVKTDNASVSLSMESSSSSEQAMLNELPPSNPSAKQLHAVATQYNIKYIIDMYHYNRRLATLPSNEHGIQACVSIIKSAQV